MVDTSLLDLLGFNIPTQVIQIIEAAFIVFLVTFVILYIYVSVAIMHIAKKTNTPKSWLAFIPIANVYLMAKMADLSGWYTTSLLLSIVPVVGSFLTTATMIFIWWRIAEKMGRQGWWSILMLVPILNLVLLGIMAWGKDIPAIQETMPQIK